MAGPAGVRQTSPDGSGDEEALPSDRRSRTREKLRKLLQDGVLEDREVEVEVSQSPSIEGMMIPMGGMEGMDHNFTEMLQDMLPKRTKRRTVSVAEARRIFLQEELDRLVDMDEVVNEALDRAEDSGMIFLDEIDKIAGARGGAGPDVSREGVQRDLLPVVEGSNVQTKYGLVRTDHMLFIAAGAFHVAKPSDLIPELQGRFPIRVELHSLGEDEFIRILTGTQERPAPPVQGPGGDRGGGPGVHRGRSQGDRPDRRRAQRPDGEHRGPAASDRPHHGPGGRSLRPPGGGEGTRSSWIPPFVRERLSGILEDEDLQTYIL